MGLSRKIYLLRHGQSTFNALPQTSSDDPTLIDAPLSELGRQQVAVIAKEVQQLQVDLIVTSPLTRALQTAIAVVPSLSSPILVHPLLRERLFSTCDIGRSPDVLATEFPTLDFSHLDPIWWHQGTKDGDRDGIETLEVFEQRITAFCHWLKIRPERSILVVGHSDVFVHLTGRKFRNGELGLWEKTDLILAKIPEKNSHLAGFESFPPDLIPLIEDSLSRRLDKSITIATLKGQPLKETSTHPISRLHLTLTNGYQLSLIFKQFSSQLSQDGGREVLIYRKLLADGYLDPPQLYASIYDTTEGQYWLVLEDIDGQRLEQWGLEGLEASIRWAAKMHARFYDRLSELKDLGCLDEQTKGFYQTLANTAESRIAQLDDRQLWRDFEERMKAFRETIAYLDTQPQTLIHGDLSDHNLFGQKTVNNPHSLRIRVIDWEWAGIGVMAWDLNKLLSHGATAKSQLIESYCQEFALLSGITLDRHQLGITLHHCQIMRILWNLGCPDPPPQGVCWDVSGMVHLLEMMESLQRFSY